LFVRNCQNSTNYEEIDDGEDEMNKYDFNLRRLIERCLEKFSCDLSLSSSQNWINIKNQKSKENQKQKQKQKQRKAKKSKEKQRKENTNINHTHGSDKEDIMVFLKLICTLGALQEHEIFLDNNFTFEVFVRHQIAL